MDREEPVLISAEVVEAVGSGHQPVGDGTPAAALYDDEDDEDAAASVGGPAEEDDEPGATDATAVAEEGTAQDGEGLAAPTVPTAPPPDGSDQHINQAHNGESVEAIEAAVASLALQKPQRARSQTSVGSPQRRVPIPAAPPDDAEIGVATSEPSRQEAEEVAAACEPSTSGADEEAATQWNTYPKHFFILSSSGKPIYSYNGDEGSLVGLSALISALVSVVESHGDAVQHIRSGSTLIVFMLRGPLYFVAASSVGEPATALRKQLELLYLQLVLVVTTGLERIIQRNPSYDVRSLLDGVGGVLSALVGLMAADSSYLLGAYKPLPVPSGDRMGISAVLSEAVRQSGAVYGLLMADTYIVAMSRAKQQPALHPDDVLLMANFVMCNNAYRHGHGEAFSPVCMPHYNSDAFLHAYIHYLDATSGLYIVLLSGSAEAFHQLASARVWFEEQAAARGLMPRLQMLRPPEHPASAAAHGGRNGSGVGGSGGGGGGGELRLPPQQQSQHHLNVLSVESLPRPLGGKFGHTALWSYGVRFAALQQAVFSPPCPLHRSPEGAARLAASYAQLHSLLHSPASPTRPNKFAWFADSQAVLVACRDRELELYLVCHPLTDKAAASGLLEAMRRHFSDRGIAADVTLPATAATA